MPITKPIWHFYLRRCIVSSYVPYKLSHIWFIAFFLVKWNEIQLQNNRKQNTNRNNRPQSYSRHNSRSPNVEAITVFICEKHIYFVLFRLFAFLPLHASRYAVSDWEMLSFFFYFWSWHLLATLNDEIMQFCILFSSLGCFSNQSNISLFLYSCAVCHVCLVYLSTIYDKKEAMKQISGFASSNAMLNARLTLCNQYGINLLNNIHVWSWMRTMKLHGSQK